VLHNPPIPPVFLTIPTSGANYAAEFIFGTGILLLPKLISASMSISILTALKVPADVYYRVFE
jgi:hypothetical protein